MKSWYDIYRERMNSNYLGHVRKKYAPFISKIKEQEGTARTFTEIGCGAGNITKLVREFQGWDDSFFHSMIDACPKMLGLAIRNNPTWNCDFRCADITKVRLPKSDVIHSHGLLEHFDDDKIRRILLNGLESASDQLHYVPSAKYAAPSRGDERLLTPDYWERVLRTIRGTGAITTVETFNDDYDIILRVRRYR